MTTFFFLFNITVGYLVGSICSAVIVCKLFELPDPRHEGSKNPGATNVLRIAGKQYAVIVLIADMLKGLLPVLLARFMDAGPITVGFTCLAAVIGHMYPLYFNFKGGKGVATALGALLAFHFILGVMVIATWLLVANFSRYSSLASIVSMILAPFYSIFSVGNLSAFPPIMCIAIFILYQHRDNITRLIDGKESKIDFRPNALLNVASNEAQFTEKAPKKATVVKAVKTTKTVKTAAEKAPKVAKTAKTAKTPSKVATKKKPVKAKKPA